MATRVRSIADLRCIGLRSQSGASAIARSVQSLPRSVSPSLTRAPALKTYGRASLGAISQAMRVPNMERKHTAGLHQLRLDTPYVRSVIRRLITPADSGRVKRSRHRWQKYASRAPRSIATFRRRCFANLLCASLHHLGGDRKQSCPVPCSSYSHSRHRWQKYASRAPRSIATFRRRCSANRLYVSLHHPGDGRRQSCLVPCSWPLHSRRCLSSNLNDGARQSADHWRCSANLLPVCSRCSGDGQKSNCRASGCAWPFSSVSLRRALRLLQSSGQSWSWQIQFGE
jgi:hypothetical protein